LTFTFHAFAGPAMRGRLFTLFWHVVSHRRSNHHWSRG